MQMATKKGSAKKGAKNLKSAKQLKKVAPLVNLGGGLHAK
jgi:hypothetical protein